jgi:succinate dehydrogenase / fumarate reductase iron-sulfur subunit
MAVVEETQTQTEQTVTKRIRVYRYKPGDGREHFDKFDVPVGPNTTVLDALHWIQLHHDPSLTMRHSCLHASCGTCGVKVDGREELACVCALADHGDEVLVEPLDNLPILGDLVVDRDSFYERFPDDHPIIRASEMFPEAEVPEGHETYVRLEDCIECGLCLSACPVAATACEYVGPAALSAAERLLEEPRGTDRDDILAWADREDGAWRCHVAMECTRACPAEALPAERIMALRRELTFDRHGAEHSSGRHRNEEAAK